MTTFRDTTITFLSIGLVAVLLTAAGCTDNAMSDEPTNLDMVSDSTDGTGDADQCNLSGVAPVFTCTDDSQCGDGEVCAPTSQCFPSSCTCDPETGEANCTTDCRQVNTCQPGDPDCEGPDPSNVVTCTDAVECAPGQICAPSPTCVPSTCSCDAGVGGWVCTDDCGLPNVCQPNTTACEGPNPADVTTCEDISDCAPSEDCIPSPNCVPSECLCTDSGDWACTNDCTMPNVCFPVPGETCDGDNPAGCLDGQDCGPGEVCVKGDQVCLPSSCTCDPSTNMWVCTRDCGGGVCQASQGACTTDADCPMGQEWCENGQCVECDNGGLLCDIACQDGYVLEERNGCFPCNCVPINECTSDEQCGANQTCVPGGLCLTWCQEGDPACCHGNTCK